MPRLNLPNLSNLPNLPSLRNPQPVNRTDNEHAAERPQSRFGLSSVTAAARRLAQRMRAHLPSNTGVVVEGVARADQGHVPPPPSQQVSPRSARNDELGDNNVSNTPAFPASTTANIDSNGEDIPALIAQWEQWATEGGPDENRAEAIAALYLYLDERVSRTHTPLNLSRLNLRTLPEMWPHGLTSLNLSYNRLTSLPDSLRHTIAHTIAILNLRNNRLTRLDLRGFTALETLSAQDNRLTAFPELPTPTHSRLRIFHLENNQISELPRTLPGDRRYIRLYLSGNPLPPHVIRALQPQVPPGLRHRTLRNRRRGNSHRTGLQLNPSNNQVTNKFGLARTIETWKREAGMSAPLTENEIQVIDSLNESQADAVKKLLTEFRRTEEYKQNKVATAMRVARLIQELCKDPDAIVEFSNMALVGTTSCEDRVALTMIELENLLHKRGVLKEALSQPDLHQALNHLQNKLGPLCRYNQLADFATKHDISKPVQADVIEIVLKFLVELSDDLDLPSKMSHMMYLNSDSALAVTSEIVSDAKTKILEESAIDHPEYQKFWCQFDITKQVIENFNANLHSDILDLESGINESISKEMTPLCDQRAEIVRTLGRDASENDAEYLEAGIKINELAEKRDVQVSNLWVERVRALLAEAA